MKRWYIPRASIQRYQNMVHVADGHFEEPGKFYLCIWTHTVYCVGMCVRMYATCECSILWKSSTWVNKLLYKMLLFLFNIILMNHNVFFCILVTAFLIFYWNHILLYKATIMLLMRAVSKNTEWNPASHLLICILLVQKGQYGFHL